MPTTARFYRCRVHDGATAIATFTSPATAGGNALVVTSVRGGVNPYIAEPPSGDGQSIDLVTGASEIGEYHVQVIDETVATATRVVTSVLADATARWQLLSRRAVIEWSADGATWTTMVLGYLNSLRLSGALVWDLTIGETRRVELRSLLFRDVSPPTVPGAVLLSPSCLIGGPIRHGVGYGLKATAFSGVEDFGPARFRVTWIGHQNANELSLELVGGWLAPYYAKQYAEFKRDEIEAANLYAKEFFAPDDVSWAWNPASDSNCYGSFPGLAAQLRRVSDGAVVTCRPLAIAARKVSSFPLHDPSNHGPFGTYDELVTKDNPLRVEWLTATMGPKPAVGTLFDVVVYPREPTAAFPIHERGHPVDLVTAKFTAAGVAYDAAAAATARAAINTVYGGAVVCELTWDGTQKLAQYAQELLAFFGVGLRVSGAGALQMFGLRHSPPASGVTITLAHLRDAETDTFDLGEDSAVTTAEQRTREYLYTRASERLTDGTSVPLDNLRPAWHTVKGATDDTVDPSAQRTHRWEIPGRVLVDGRPQYLEAMAAAAGNWLVNWRRRGVPEFELRCLSTVTAQVGDVVTVNLPHIPVAVTAAVPTTQRGQAAISARVLRRTETPAGPDLRLVYAPALNQAPLPSPATRSREPGLMILPKIELEPLASETARVVLVTLVNALDILAARQLVVFEYAFVTAGEPAPTGSGTQVGPYDPADAPAEPVRYALPSAPAGSVVWVRARTVTPNAGGTSAWTEWISLSLSLLPEGVRVSWILSPLTGSGVRCELSVTDPAGTIARVEMRFKQRFADAWPGGATWPPESVIAPNDPDVDPRIYQLDGTLIDGYEGYFGYRLSAYTPPEDPEDPEAVGTFTVLEERTIPVGSGANRPAVLAIRGRAFARSRESGGSYAVGQTGATITVDARTKSVRVLASKTAVPTEVEVAASSVVYNIAAGSFTTETDPLVTLTYGEQAFIAVLPYAGAAGTGAVGALAWDAVRYGEATSGEVGRSRIDPKTAYTDTLANFTAGLQVNGSPVLTATSSPDFFTVGGSYGGNSGIEIGNDMAVGTTPFIDFHFGVGSANDYSGRLISRGQHQLAAEFLNQNVGKFLVAGYALMRPLTYGGLRLPDMTSGWAGIEFSGAGINFMVGSRYQGMHTAAGWIYQWDNGSLAIGSVPPARVPAGTFNAGVYTFPGQISVTGIAHFSTAEAQHFNALSSITIAGTPVASVIISTLDPSGTLPAGTLWCKVAPP